MTFPVFGEELSSLDEAVYSKFTTNDLETLISKNTSLPVTVQSVEVNGANCVRNSFLECQTSDILNKQHTLPSLLSTLGATAQRLERFGIFKNTKFSIDLADQLFSSEAEKPTLAGKPLDLKATLSVERTPVHPFYIKTIIQDDIAGALVGGALTNLFGGAESLSAQVAYDSSPRSLSSYYVNFATPIKGSPDLQAHAAYYQLTRANSWASHSTALRGFTAKVTSSSAQYPGSLFEGGIEAVQRTVTSISDDASESVRATEGTISNKTSVFSRFTIDRRDNPVYPTEGYKVECQSELAGVIGGSTVPSDVSYLKATGAASYSKSLDPVNNNLIFNMHAGSGLLWTYNKGEKGSQSSMFDRFYLGGKSSGPESLLYGYQYNGLGPKDSFDSVGGDAFSVGSLSFLGKLPKLSSTHPLSPLRFMLFFSGASLVPVSHSEGGSGSLKSSLVDIFSKPSTCAGAGLVYKTPQAQLELVYSVPLRSREEDWARKGLQFTAGLEVDF